MKNTQFLCIGVLGLIIVCIWQFSRILDLDNQIQIERETKEADIEKEYQHLAQTFDENQQHFVQLKAVALWQDSDDLLLWLASQAEAVKVRVIGVEQLPTRKNDAFLESPVRLKVHGDYHSLGRFINRVERSDYPIKIIHFRLFSLKYEPDLILYLVVAKVQAVGEQILDKLQINYEKKTKPICYH